MSLASEKFAIRPATMGDIAYLVRHRCEMFKDMGSLSAEAYPFLAEQTRQYYERAMPEGEYVAWVATPLNQPETIVAGGGMQIRQILPRPDTQQGIMKSSVQGIIVNVYTEHDWRRNGLAERLVEAVLQWSRQNNVGSVVLHASEMGRPLYERMGFVQTNEMRYTGDLLD